jgi:hypothetical protein
LASRQPAQRWHDLAIGFKGRTGEPAALMSRENPKGGTLTRERVPMQSRGAEQLVVATKALKGVGAKGLHYQSLMQ